MKRIVAKRDDVVFYLKMFPVVQLHPGAYEKAKAIVCQESNDKGLRLLEDAYAGMDLPKATCVTDAVKKNIDLAARLEISGTPTLIFGDGFRHNGSIEETRLIKLLEEHKGQ